MGSILGLFSSSTAMWLVIVAFIAGLVIMWWLRGLLGRLFGSTPIVRYYSLVSAIHKVNELVAIRAYFEKIIDYIEPTAGISTSRILLVLKGKLSAISICRRLQSMLEKRINALTSKCRSVNFMILLM